MLVVPDVMRSVLLCLPEVIRCVLLCMLEVVEVPEVMRCAVFCLVEDWTSRRRRTAYYYACWR